MMQTLNTSTVTRKNNVEDHIDRHGTDHPKPKQQIYSSALGIVVTLFYFFLVLHPLWFVMSRMATTLTSSHAPKCD